MRPTGPRSHITCNPRELTILKCVQLASQNLRGPSGTCIGGGRIEPEVALGQWLTALLVVVMMLQHYTRLVPFPEGAPTHSADFACRSGQLQCPRRMGLGVDISGNGRPGPTARPTTDVGH